MSMFESYKDHKKERLTYSDVQYNAINKLFNYRCQPDLTEYQRAVTALEIIMNGFTDDTFAQEWEFMENRYNVIKEHEGDIVANTWLFDQKAKILCSLIARTNEGPKKLLERIEKSKIIEEIANKLMSGTGQNLLITGPPGSGKSWSALKLGIEVGNLTGTEFDIRRVCFSPEQFLQIYNDEKICPPGSFIIFDEVGVSQFNRDFASKPNKLFSKLMQTIRHRQILVIFTTPHIKYIDAAQQPLLHWWFETNKLSKRENLVYVKPHTVEIQQQSGKILFPFPIYDGDQLSKLAISRVDDDVAEQYEIAAKKFKDELAAHTQRELAQLEKDPDLKRFIELRKAGNTITKIRTELLKMSSTKAARLEKEYKIVQNIQTNDNT